MKKSNFSNKQKNHFKKIIKCIFTDIAASNISWFRYIFKERCSAAAFLCVVEFCVSVCVDCTNMIYDARFMHREMYGKPNKMAAEIDHSDCVSMNASAKFEFQLIYQRKLF